MSEIFTIDCSKHAYALDVSGYTILPRQVGEKELVELRACADRALQAAQTSGATLRHTGQTDYYKAVRCMYCWGAACERLLEHEAVHALASKLMETYQLWDMVVMSALPTPAAAKAATTSWHRDAKGLLLGTQVPAYLWFFLCLDDVTPENGATWVVLGSHRLDSRHEPLTGNAWTGDELENYPSRIQPCARAGDFLVMDPTMLHDPQPFAGRFHENTGAAPQLCGFVSAIRGGNPPCSTLEDMIETQLLIEQIVAATKT